jgi:hypothetical protein
MQLINKIHISIYNDDMDEIKIILEKNHSFIYDKFDISMSLLSFLSNKHKFLNFLLTYENIVLPSLLFSVISLIELKFIKIKEEYINENTKFERFIKIILKLPIEIQMNICNKIYNSNNKFIKNKNILKCVNDLLLNKKLKIN